MFFFSFFIHQLPQKAFFSIVTQSHAISHLIFALIVGLCAYNFFRSITLDPGTCPKPTSDDELKSVKFLSLFGIKSTEIFFYIRLLKILRLKVDSTVRLFVFNAWLVNPSDPNTVVYVTNVLQGATSKLLDV